MSDELLDTEERINLEVLRNLVLAVREGKRDFLKIDHPCVIDGFQEWQKWTLNWLSRKIEDIRNG